MTKTLPLLSLFLLLSSTAFAAEESPAEISKKSRERGALNLVGLSARVKLVTERKDGKSKEQVLQTTSKKIDGRTHSLARFIQPGNVAGITVLTIETAPGSGSNDMSLYLPKLRRVRKVAASQRGQSFFDTDFNYADLGGTGAIADGKVQRKEDAKVDGRDTYVLTGKPAEDSPYGRITVWVDKQTYVPMRVDYEDKEGKPLKTYRTLELKKFKERVLAAKSVMENVQTGSKTTMSLQDVSEADLADDAFTERALERG